MEGQAAGCREEKSEIAINGSAALKWQGQGANERGPYRLIPFGLIEIVNLGERFPGVIQSGIAAATLGMRESGSLRVVRLAYLIALNSSCMRAV